MPDTQWSAALRPIARHAVLVPLLLALTAALTIPALFGDSITFDEPVHLTSGFGYWRTGDFRLGSDHPPLAKLWLTWPLLFVDPRWPEPGAPEWTQVDDFGFGLAHRWLCELNDGERLMRIGRLMMLPILLGTCLATYALARRTFGPAPGLLALVLACFCPSLMAHGHLVTTDVPITLCCGLTLLCFGRLLRAVTWPRLLAAVTALAAASVTKVSWVLLLPALGAMGFAAIWRRRGIMLALAPFRSRRPRLLPGRLSRTMTVLAIAGFAAVTTWGGIWATYGFRHDMLAPGSEPEVRAGFDRQRRDAFYTSSGQPRTGLKMAAVRFVVDHHLLPEAYVYGFARAYKRTGERAAYFGGQFSHTGWWYYFPITWAVKTPVATILLILTGLALVLTRRVRVRDGVLLAGLLAFVVAYGGQALRTNLNIGERHLLPLYPVLFVLGGAAAGVWLGRRMGQLLVGIAVAWLIGAAVFVHPQYLAYFNELAGGPRHGDRWLADSNLDWGQDLWRLARYATQHPDEKLKVAYFGTADPRQYGFSCDLLPSYAPVDHTRDWTAGTYVISISLWVGLYCPAARDEPWQDERVLRRYAELHAYFSRPGQPHDARYGIGARQEYDRLRWGRLVHRLRQRGPDERIGYSLLAYRLTAADLDDLTQP